MAEQKTVGDVMVPLSEYAVVDETASLREALIILEEAQRGLPAGAPLHRAVLVRDAAGEIVGRLGHHGFLAALEPKYEILGDLDRVARAGLSEEFVDSILDSYRFWQNEFDDIRGRAERVAIGRVMRPVSVSIEADRSLGEAVHFLIMHEVLSLLVTCDGCAVGILRISDLFREISTRVIANGPKA